MGAINSSARTFRWTVGKWSKETGWGIFAWIIAWRIARWFYRRGYIITRHHPAAAAVLAAMFVGYLINPIIPLGALAGAFLAVGILIRYQPDQYRAHLEPRVKGTLQGFRYRYGIRNKLMACGLIDKDDPTPLPVRTRVHGCTTELLIKQVRGQELEWWRVRSARLAQTFNALECKADPYRVGKKTYPHYVKLDLLAKDPFSSDLRVEYIDYHAAETLSPVVATYRTGATQGDNLAAHSLAVAMTRWGKSNRIRAKLYAQRHNLAAGLLENWLIDGKGGVEGAFMERFVTRHAYGDVEAEPETYDPAEFDQLLKDAVTVMKRRQKKMRGFVTEHIPTPTEPWLRIIIDEILVLTSKSVPSELRTSIAASVNLIFQQGIACGVSIDASTQLGKKDKLDPIDRDGFTEFEIGRVERGVVDMIFGTGWWERGAKADEIPRDLKGVFYRKTDTTMAPREIRYPFVSVADLNTMPPVGESVLWRGTDLLVDLGFA